MVQAWTLAKLKEYVGGLSAPSKMPCHGYSLPAQECKTGGRLQNVAGSTCSGCYAMKGNYLWPNVRAALYRRLESLSKPLWAEVMAELINRKEANGFFRWHDSGDLQSPEHLAAIVKVCNLTPTVQHWLPTREYRIVSEYVRDGGVIPPNLNVRMSAHMIGGHLPTFKGLPVTVSTVSREEDSYPDSHHCPARFQGNSCGDCRACWSPDVAHVDYHLH